MPSIFRMTFLRVLLLLAFWAVPVSGLPLSALAAEGGERILLYDSQAEFRPDGSMLLTEKLTVQARGERIKRGLERDIPLRWNRSDNRRFMLSCEVLSVTRNGAPEPFFATSDGNGFFLRIGQADRLLQPGEHTYVISYLIKNNFSRFEAFDELYYNVTGNGWRLPIDEARFRLALPVEPDDAALSAELEEPPAGVRAPDSGKPAYPFYSIDVYTGFAGQRESKAQITADGGVRTTAPLLPGQGLTVAYTWPRGILGAAQPPLEYNPVKKALLPDFSTLPLFAVPLLMLLYYGRAVYIRRPAGGRPGVIPLYAPPAGLTPGQLRYALKGHYDQDSFAADILRLVSLGAIRLQKGAKSGKRGNITLSLGKAYAPGKAAGEGAASARAGKTGMPPELSEREGAAMELLFSEPSAVISLGKTRLSAVRDAYDHFAGAAKGERNKLFTKFKRPLGLWIFIFALLPALCIGLYGAYGALPVCGAFIFFACFALFLSFMTYQMLRAIKSVSFARRIFPLLFMIPFWFGVFVAANQTLPPLVRATTVPDGFYSAFLLCLLLPVLYLLLVPRRTALGLERQAQAKGLIMYMEAAEKRRLEALYPPTADVEHFEKLFPYALALGVGKTWADTFAGYLAHSGQTAQNLRDLSWQDTRGLSSSLSYAACRTASGGGGGFSGGRGGGSGSGSGSGGGGSSGGGSGGGGGGGW